MVISVLATGSEARLPAGNVFNLYLEQILRIWSFSYVFVKAIYLYGSETFLFVTS